MQVSHTPSWRAPVFIDRRSLTERQRKYLEMFADDIEGRPTTEGTAASASAPSASPSSESPQEETPAEGENEEKPLGG